MLDCAVWGDFPCQLARIPLYPQHESFVQQYSVRHSVQWGYINDLRSGIRSSSGTHDKLGKVCECLGNLLLFKLIASWVKRKGTLSEVAARPSATPTAVVSFG